MAAFLNNEVNKRTNADSIAGHINKKHARDPRTLIPNDNIENNYNVKTSNSFEMLNNLSDNSDKMDDTSVPTTQSNDKQNKPPPIFLKTAVDYKQFCKLLTDTAGKQSFSCVATIRGITVRPSTPDAYRKIVTLFRQENVQFHTYQLHEDKAYRFVIRGLHPSIPHEDIKEELEQLGHKVRLISNVFSRQKQALPLFFVDIEPNTNNSEVFTIKSLLNSIIQVEEPRKKRQIVQCIRCQQYGHTRSYCNYCAKCVKCGQNHDASACPKKAEDHPTCANCGEQHPANYRGCIVHKQLQQRRSPQYSSDSKTQITRQHKYQASDFPQIPGSHRTTHTSQSRLTQNVRHPPAIVSSSSTQASGNNISSNHEQSNNNINNNTISYSNIVNRSSPVSSSSPHLNSRSLAHDSLLNNTQTTLGTPSLATLLNQLQSLLQPLCNLITQLTYATQCFINQNGP